MALWDGIKKQFIEVLEWQETSNDVLAYRFPVAGNEIKDGAQLTVRDSQAALFVNEGETADVFGAGRHELTTANLPMLTKLKSWVYGFNSPFKADVYFYSLRQKLGQKWGTRQPITLRDAEFGSVQLRMFGVHSYHVDDVRKFYKEVSGTRERFTTDDLVNQLLPTIVSAATATFANSKVPFLDMAANLPLLSSTLSKALEDPFAKLGLALDSFIVEAVSLPEALEQALQTRQQIALTGNIQEYAQFQAAKSIPDAARNPNSIAGIGMGIAAAAGLTQAMNQALGQNNAGPQPPHTAGTPTLAPPAANLTACIACSKNIDVASAFCRFCGASQKRSCPNCQAAVEPGSAFCGSCGTKIG